MMPFGLRDALFGSPATVDKTSAEGALADNVDLAALEGTAKQQLESAGRNTGRIQAGKAGADFWQGTRENFSGIENKANRANLGAELGTNHSVMDNAGVNAGAAEQLGKTSRLAGQHVEDRGAHKQGQMADATAALERGIHDSEIKEMDRASRINALLGFGSSAISGYTAGTSFLENNPGARDTLEGVKGSVKQGARDFGSSLWNSEQMQTNRTAASNFWNSSPMQTIRGRPRGDSGGAPVSSARKRGHNTLAQPLGGIY